MAGVFMAEPHVLHTNIWLVEGQLEARRTPPRYRRTAGELRRTQYDHTILHIIHGHD
jgi:hypothetical protein